MTNEKERLSLVLSEGEGQTIEFKQGISGLDKEMVAFANAIGGSIYVGVNDQATITGIKHSNRLVSQIQDTARNCDPSVKIKIKKLEQVIEVVVEESVNKPHRCQGGFYLRVGPNSQKLTRDEILAFAIGEGRVRFDEQFNAQFSFEVDFSTERFAEFSRLAKLPADFSSEDVLVSLNVAERQKGKLLLKNAGVLFFAKDPQRFFSEAFVTCVRYHGVDRTTIIDRKDMKGSLLEQVQEAKNFIERHIDETFTVAQGLSHETRKDYPSDAVREALVNAVMHRDYLYDGSHVYVHLFDDRLEIDNPGGLFKGLTLEDLGKRSVRRNRLIADLFFRVGYIEMVGSGIGRILAALRANGNPEPQIQATNFFQITFKKSIGGEDKLKLTERQKQLYHFLLTRRGDVSKKDCAQFLNVSDDTALREIKVLLQLNLLQQTGRGKSVRYTLPRK